MTMRREILIIASFVLIAVMSFSLRMYKVTAPIGDWHSWRQADTAAVSRNFLRFGIDPLHPRYDDLSNIQSGKDNPEGYRMVEFPFYQMTAAVLAIRIPQISLEVWLRILSAIVSTATGILLGILLVRRVNTIAGIAAALVYAILPYSMYYGRSILPDVHAAGWAIGSVFIMDFAFEEAKVKRKWFLVLCGAVLAAVAILIKPTAGFLLLPVIGIAWAEKKKIVVNCISVIVYGAVALLPFFFWRQWIAQYPEGIPAFDWLLNGNGIRFKGAWFYWLFAERIAKLILGYWGLVFLGLGLLAKREKREKGIVLWFIAGALLYMGIFATGNVQHDYYQIIILPTMVVLVAKGIVWVSEQKSNRVNAFLVGVVSFLFMLAFSWYTIRTYYWINRPEIIEAGHMADMLLPKSAKVIAPYNGDTTFLYQTGRQGWPLGFEIDKKIQMGATHYVTVSPTDADLETKELSEKYTVLVRNGRYAIIDLTKQK